jgi:hypothetical protein
MSSPQEAGEFDSYKVFSWVKANPMAAFSLFSLVSCSLKYDDNGAFTLTSDFTLLKRSEGFKKVIGDQGISETQVDAILVHSLNIYLRRALNS